MGRIVRKVLCERLVKGGVAEADAAVVVMELVGDLEGEILVVGTPLIEDSRLLSSGLPPACTVCPESNVSMPSLELRDCLADS